MAEKNQGGSDNDDDKTEEPSQQRLDDFREEGQVAQSREFTSLFVMLSALAVMWGMGPGLVEQFFEVTRKFFIEAGTTELNQEAAGKALMAVIGSSAQLVLPIAGAGFVAGVLGSIVQIGINFSWTPITPDASRIDPIQGAFKIFSLNALVEGLKAFLKLAAVTVVTYFVIKNEIVSSPAVLDMEGWQLGAYFTSTGFRLIGSVSIALFVISSLDLAYQKYRFWKALMMTKQEVKEESKQREGDPLLKARIRSIQREFSRKRMIQDVPKADVIVTNPTHIAVALKYDSESMAAPKVIAKGADHLAQRIKEIAKKNGVPLVENVPLARALHKSVKVGRTVPKNLYQAVAEVLAYVYRLKGRTKL